MRPVLALTILTLATGAAVAEQAIFDLEDQVIVTPDEITIVTDFGGDIDNYMSFIDSDKFAVRITGTCLSSCTMFLSAKRVCFEPNAVFGFHAPVLRSMGEGALTAQKIEQQAGEIERLTAEMAARLPYPLNEKFLSEWSKSLDMTWLTGADIVFLVPSITGTCGVGRE